VKRRRLGRRAPAQPCTWPASREVDITDRDAAADPYAGHWRDIPTGFAQLAARRRPRPAPATLATPPALGDALTALADALDDAVAFAGVRLALLALDAELITDAQRGLLTAAVYDLADATTRAFA
ncbi:MAG TPA: hypothetical protein VFH56_05710, partial [Acidimicrobiales bacterium]|nr:hypothetical protein [Acidimicrobiales bacterium]